MAQPTEDALIDPNATAQVADIYGRNGQQYPGLEPPKFLTDAIGTMTNYGNRASDPYFQAAQDRGVAPAAPGLFQNSPQQEQAANAARQAYQQRGGAYGYLNQPEGLGGLLNTAGRTLGAGSSSLNVGTITADRVIPDVPAKIAARDMNVRGGQGLLSDRFDSYRSQGLAVDDAANKTMEDYGNALGKYAESPDQNIIGRTVAQGARVAGALQSLTAPAPLPGGASIPFAAGILKNVGARGAGYVFEDLARLAKNPSDLAGLYNKIPLFHGTASEIEKVHLDPAMTSPDGLFGMGVYLTDSPSIAESYAKVRSARSGAPNIYQASVDISNALDMERPLPPNVVQAVKAALSKDYYGRDFDLSKISNLGTTGSALFRAIRSEAALVSSDLRVPLYEFSETFGNVSDAVRSQGYDALHYSGGTRVGSQPHNALVVLDPSKVRDWATIGSTAEGAVAKEIPNFARTAEDLIREAHIGGAAADNLRQGAMAQDIATRAVDTITGRAAANIAAITPDALKTAEQQAIVAPTKEAVFHEIGSNLDKMGVDQETKELIVQNAASNFDELRNMSFADQRRGVVSISDTIRTAAEKVPGLDLAQLAATPRGTAMNAETLTAVGMSLNKAALDVSELAARVAETGNNADKAQLILRAIEMNTLQRVFAGGRAEAGRSLRALRETIAAGSGPRSMYDAAINAVGGKDNADALIAAISEHWTRPGVSVAQKERDIYALVNGLKDRKALAWIPELWRNSILSNPLTHEINAIGNTIVLVSERGLARTVAAGAEAARAGFGLRNVERQVYFSEIVPGIVGGLRGMPKGLQQGLEILKNGVSPTDVSKFIESDGRVLRGEAIPGALGKAVNAPTRLLAGVDQFFDQVAYTAEMYSQAARAAAKEGLRGKDFATKVAQLRADPTAAMMNAARDSANLITLKTDADGFTKAIMGVVNWKFPASEVAPLRFVVPFIQTPANLLKLGAAYSPLGTLRALSPLRPMGAEQRALMLGRSAVGSVLMGFFATKLVNGEATAGYPSDPQARKQFIAEGKLPYSVRIGENWVQFRRFEPLSTPLNWAAAMYDAHQRTEGQEWGSAIPEMSLAIGRAMLDASYLSGMSGLVNALENPSTSAESFFASIATGFVPFSGFLRGLEQSGDKYFRDPDNLLQMIEAQLPGLSGMAPTQVGPITLGGVRPKQDVTGEPQQRPDSKQGVGAMISPWTYNQATQNPTIDELNRLRTPDQIGPDGATIEGTPLSLSFPSQDIRSLKLNPDEAFGLNQISQRMTISNLDKLFASRDYLAATDWQKRELAQRAISDARTTARSLTADQVVSEAHSPESLARGVVMKIGTIEAEGGRSKYGQRASYLADLDKTGKMSSTVKSAVDSTRSLSLDGLPEPTVDEYLTAAPLVTEFMSHVPYGTDANPIGTPADWQAVDTVTENMRERVAYLIETSPENVPASVANDRAKNVAQQEALRSMSPIQRNIFLNGSIPGFANNQRAQLVKKYGIKLTRFLSPKKDIYQEPIR